MTPILSANDTPDPSLMGGKAAALARLSRAGFPVPAWFVVCPGVAGDDPTGVSPDTVAAIGRSLGELPSDAGFAVRSSAVDEDGAQHSFAGQLESYLFVPPERVIDRVRDVRTSGFSPRVIAYRNERGMRGEPAVPAVLVQQMVNAEVSGVAFGADPISGRRSVIVISAVFGLGTALVGGEADADTWRLDQGGRIIEQRIARKSIRHVADPAQAQGVRTEALEEAQATRPALDEQMLRRIATLVVDAGRHFGRPQDIEWAVAGGRLYLLQSRPITSLADLADPDGALAIWDNSNIAESYSGITTPLTFSFAQRAYEGVYREFCRIMKVPRAVIRHNDAMFGQMLGLIRGRIYYNLLNWYRLLAMLPGFAVNQRFMEQMMGVREGLPADLSAAVKARTWSQRWGDRLRLGWSVLALGANHLVLPRKIRAFYARLRGALQRPASEFPLMRLDELAAEFRRLEAELLSRWDAPLVNDFLAMIFFGVFGKLCRSWCGQDGLHNDLIADEGGIISTQPAQRIMEMGRLAAGDQELVEILCAAPPGEAAARLSASPQLQAAYQSYLETFGDRCLEELKLESATLVDDPTPLLRSIGHTARRLRQGNSSAPASRARPRQAAEELAAQSLRRHPLRRWIFRWVSHHARGRVRDRENLRFERTRVFGRVRRIFVAIGQRLRAEGRLDEERDVFFLTLDEILGFVEGTSPCEDLRGLTKLRRKLFEQYRTMKAPADRFETLGAVYVGNRFETPHMATVAPTGNGELRGIGCCPGIVRGPVRVIREPVGAALRHGEILVAERTDPGWIMLFPAAAGILVERGSLLSHSAIVAREMGIPAIVSIPQLTAVLADGQWVEMDGSAGTVQRIEPPPAEEGRQ